MHRIDGPGAVSALPTPRPDGTPGFFSRGNPALGQQSTRVTEEWCNAVQEEIVGVIEQAGIVLDKTDNKQLVLAIMAMINAGRWELVPGLDGQWLATENGRIVWRDVPPKYDLCEFYFFRHPTLRAGFAPAQGGLLANAAELYPAVWEYLQTVEGHKLCKTEAEWQTMTTDTWATLADGTKVGWNGIGGAPFYAPNFATGALRLPDLRGMYVEAAGYDSLGVGSVHGDASRKIDGIYRSIGDSRLCVATGPFYNAGNASRRYSDGSASDGPSIGFDTSRVGPTAAKNQPRAWGALACVYLGQPAS